MVRAGYEGLGSWQSYNRTAGLESPLRVPRLLLETSMMLGSWRQEGRVLEVASCDVMT